MPPSKPFFAVIMAGGTGTRLWPLSRKSKPKQFYPFLSEKTLLQETYERVKTVVSPDHIFISTGDAYVDQVCQQLPEINRDQVLPEPASRNTGMAILLVTALLEKRFPGAVIAALASDHAIGNPEEFTALLNAAFLAAEQEKVIVTLGINPTRPDTGFGYIKMNGEAKTFAGKRSFFVGDFREKPDAKTAEEYLRSFEYLWNAGYFIFRAETMLEFAREYAGEPMKKIETMLQEQEENPSPENFLSAYSELENIPIDILIMEKLSPEERLVFPASLDWSDVGNWATFSEYLENQSGKKVIQRGNTLDLKSENLFVHGGDRFIATLGLDNIVIIDTPDTLLVARKDHVGTDIKELLENIKKKKDLEKYL
ncbi:MAG: sugar phosphate nucleotidyltransferase [Candidatus Moraniibacteriota bacterium]